MASASDDTSWPIALKYFIAYLICMRLLTEITGYNVIAPL